MHMRVFGYVRALPKDAKWATILPMRLSLKGMSACQGRDTLVTSQLMRPPISRRGGLETLARGWLEVSGMRSVEVESWKAAHKKKRGSTAKI